MIRPVVCFWLLLSLLACGGETGLPVPPTLPPQPTATLAPTVTLAPSPEPVPTSTPPRAAPATVAPSPPAADLATPPPLTPSLTGATGATPPMRIAWDPAQLVTVRVPRAWEMTEETRADGLQLSFADPDEGLLFLINVVPALAEGTGVAEQYVASIFGEGAAAQRETLPDGTERLTGTRPGGQRVEMRLRRRANLLAVLVAAADPARWDTAAPRFDEAFESFHLYPAQAIGLFDAISAVPTLAPDDIALLSTVHYASDSTSSPAWWVEGELENRGAVDAEMPAVRVQLLAGDGSVLTETLGFSDRELLPVGERGPFSALFQGLGPEAPVVGVNVEVEPDPSPFYFYHDFIHKGLRVEEAAFAEPPYESSRRLVGTVRNESDEPARFVRLDAALYDRAGHLVTTCLGYIEPDELAPFASAPFDFTCFRAANALTDVVDFHLWPTGFRASDD